MARNDCQNRIPTYGRANSDRTPQLQHRQQTNAANALLTANEICVRVRVSETVQLSVYSPAPGAATLACLYAVF